MLEIEKKYLLRNVPNIKYNDELNILQFYTPEGRYRSSYSNFTSQTTYYHTVKTFISAGVNEEVENIITPQEFYEKIATATKTIRKKRFIKNTKKYKWEVDQFVDCYLVIAEVEVTSEKELKKVKLPKWLEDCLIKDVTGEKEFNNYNLAINI